MKRSEVQKRNDKIYEELSNGRQPYRIAEKYGLTEPRIRQIKYEVELRTKPDTWVNEIIYPKVKMWFKRNQNALERMRNAGIKKEKVMAFLCEETRTSSVKTINTMLDIMDMSFEEAFEVREK